ncbi:MAG: lysine--tRNA ligase [Patescibacteria group bacterium]
MGLREQEEIKSRQDKFAIAKKLGEAYPAVFNKEYNIGELLAKAGDVKLPKLTDNIKFSGKELQTAGRLITVRPHGKLIFAHIQDQSGKMQIAFTENSCEKKVWQLGNLLDIGDIIGVKGILVKTKRGEVTLLCSEVELLAKAFKPMPEKWHGLKNIETRLRQRYLDLIATPETRELFIKKSLFWQSVREFLTKDGFMEVDTPALEAVAGGADANPFITHHDKLDQDFYLRISLELPLKKLLVGGFEKVFEIGKVFRNEGIDTEHLQDYDMCEFYWAYADYNILMDFTQNMYQEIVKKITGGLKTTYQAKTIDWGGNWPKKDYFELIKEISGVDLAGKTDIKELRKLLEKNKVRYEESMGTGRLIDLYWKKLVRPKVAGPLFVINHPVEVSPLAKRDAKNPERVQRMQIIVAGSELGNGFSELNDPTDQRARFEEQAKLREAGDSEAMMLDEDFITALEYGMPPAAGFGFSERLFAFIMDKPVRETVLFPPMRNK